jgi:DNA (cytosine-5)-methyltransferase 1
MNELHLFAGTGGGILGGILLGHTCVCAVEIEPYCRKVLLQRQRDGILPKFPIWDDVRTFDGKPWRGLVDVVCSGFPCQRISDIGKMHGSKGFDGWPDTIRVIREISPGIVWLENVPAILSGFSGRVIADLSDLGYISRWGVFSACSCGAPHSRERLFCMANASGIGLEAEKLGLAERPKAGESFMPSAADRAAWISRLSEPSISGIVDGLAGYMGETTAIGNGQVPAVVKLAWETLSQ